jgi:hypothetical protein
MHVSVAFCFGISAKESKFRQEKQKLTLSLLFFTTTIGSLHISEPYAKVQLFFACAAIPRVFFIRYPNLAVTVGSLITQTIQNAGNRLQNGQNLSNRDRCSFEHALEKMVMISILSINR